MKFMPLPSQASLDKVAPLGRWDPLPHDIPVETSQPPTATTPQSGSGPPDSQLFSFSQNMGSTCNHTGNEPSGQLSIQLPPHTSATSIPQAMLFRNESDAMSTDDGGLFGGFQEFRAFQPRTPDPLIPPAVIGVAQAAVFTWTHQEYCASDTLREMTCVEARVSFFLHPFCVHAMATNQHSGPFMYDV